MAHRMATVPMTLCDLEGHSAIAGLFKLDFIFSYVSIDRISADGTSSLCDY